MQLTPHDPVPDRPRVRQHPDCVLCARCRPNRAAASAAHRSCSSHARPHYVCARVRADDQSAKIGRCLRLTAIEVHQIDLVVVVAPRWCQRGSIARADSFVVGWTVGLLSSIAAPADQRASRTGCPNQPVAIAAGTSRLRERKMESMKLQGLPSLLRRHYQTNLHLVHRKLRVAQHQERSWRHYPDRKTSSMPRRQQALWCHQTTVWGPACPRRTLHLKWAGCSQDCRKATCRCCAGWWC